MFDFLKDGFVWLAKWFLDLLLWLLEFAYQLINDFLAFLISSVSEYALSFYSSIQEHIPDKLIENVTALYVWVQYIDTWIPVEFLITLFVSYIAIRAILTGMRIVLRLLPFIG